MQLDFRFEKHQPGPETSRGISSAELEWICRSALRSEFPVFKGREVRAFFYPYIGLTHTIRRRGETCMLRISDHCRMAPRMVLEAIAVILACKLLRRRPPQDSLRIYEAFRHDPATEAAVRSRRLLLGRKVIRPTGRHHDLEQYYREINSRFFNSQIDLAAIGWSARRSWTRLGHFDPVHRTVTISPVLDSSALPPFVLLYLVYHEMLHSVFDEDLRGSRRRHHTRLFRETERAFPHYAAAKKLLNEFCRSRGKGRDQ